MEHLEKMKTRKYDKKLSSAEELKNLNLSKKEIVDFYSAIMKKSKNPDEIVFAASELEKAKAKAGGRFKKRSSRRYV